MEEITSDAVTVSRMNENGFDVLRLKLPALLTVLKDINEPRVPTLKDARKARRAEITVWGPGDIGADPDLIGLNASPTRVVKTEPPAVRNTVTVKIGGEPGDAAKALVGELTGRGLL